MIGGTFCVRGRGSHPLISTPVFDVLIRKGGQFPSRGYPFSYERSVYRNGFSSFQFMSTSQVHIREKCFRFDVLMKIDVSEGKNPLHKDL